MSRNLACIFTPSDTLVPHYLEMLGAFTEGKDYQAPFADINAVTKDHLELYLKKLGPFSTFLHDFPLQTEETKGPKNEFYVRGPYVSIPLLIPRVRDFGWSRTRRGRWRQWPVGREWCSSWTWQCTCCA